MYALQYLFLNLLFHSIWKIKVLSIHYLLAPHEALPTLSETELEILGYDYIFLVFREYWFEDKETFIKIINSWVNFIDAQVSLNGKFSKL